MLDGVVGWTAATCVQIGPRGFVLAAGSKVGAANVEQQAAVILKAGVAAKMASLSIEQLTGMTETLAEKGIKAVIAGTGLKTFLLRLERDLPLVSLQRLDITASQSPERQAVSMVLEWPAKGGTTRK